VLQRRATRHFADGEVSDAHLDAILACAAQAPSGYNLQPWRFVVVREPQNRERLRKAALDQEKITEAPVVIIVLGMKEAWRERIDEVLEDGARRGAGKPEDVAETKKGALEFLDGQAMPVWVTRHAMIAATYLMLAAEAYGLATAPMEGFDPAAVKRAFDVPDEAEVVALLAIGRAREPLKTYPGRFAVEELVHRERFEDRRSPAAALPSERAEPVPAARAKA
jgi:nitroreductase